MDNKSDLKNLFQINEAYEKDYLKVSEIHSIYYELSGNKNGKPVIFLHGGPGSGLSPTAKGCFDPEFYNIIQFDQRGCGKSQPTRCLDENTTWDLVEDIEKIRNYLKIEKFHTVIGGSWGSALALVYSEKYPDNLSNLIIIGIFLTRPIEAKNLYQNITSWIFTDYYEEFISVLPEVQRSDALHSFYRIFTNDEIKDKTKYVTAWAKYELFTSYLIPDEEKLTQMLNPEYDFTKALIESHYFVNGCFLKSENQLIDESNKLKNINVTIIQGRYDMVCHLKSAWEIHKAIPHSELFIIPDAGHGFRHSGIIDRIVRTTENLK